METLTDIERARLKDLAWRIARGDYDSDRRQSYDVWDMAVFIVRHGAELIIYSAMVGMFLGSVMLAFLLLRGW